MSHQLDMIGGGNSISLRSASILRHRTEGVNFILEHFIGSEKTTFSMHAMTFLFFFIAMVLYVDIMGDTVA